MKRTFAVVSRLGCLALALGLGTANWVRGQAGPPTTSPCPSVAGAEQVLVPGAVVILSDVPGTVEAPRFASALACQSLASGKPVTLALDLPREERPAVDAFLDSDGSPAARKRLLAAPSWRQQSASLARLELLEWVRTARAAGKPIWVTLLGTDELPARSASTEREREHRMATALARAVDTTPRSVVIGLVANPHARLVRDTSANPPYPPMSYLVEQEPSGARRWCTRWTPCSLPARRGSARKAARRRVAPRSSPAGVRPARPSRSSSAATWTAPSTAPTGCLR